MVLYAVYLTVNIAILGEILVKDELPRVSSLNNLVC